MTLVIEFHAFIMFIVHCIVLWISESVGSGELSGQASVQVSYNVWLFFQ